MAEEYHGDIRVGDAHPPGREANYLDFFQTDRDGRRKGIVCLALQEIDL